MPVMDSSLNRFGVSFLCVTLLFTVEQFCTIYISLNVGFAAIFRRDLNVAGFMGCGGQKPYYDGIKKTASACSFYILKVSHPRQDTIMCM